jgi:hypothetical protein
MGYDINWNVEIGDPVLMSPQYQKWSQYTIGGLVSNATQIKTDMKEARASVESSAVVNYLAWLLRSIALVG